MSNLAYDIKPQAQIPYHPFGSVMPGRSWYEPGLTAKYKYGFNGESKEDDISGDGMAYDLGARFYDSRLGRMFSLDPLILKYPFWSPYSYGGNNPVLTVDMHGLAPGDHMHGEEKKVKNKDGSTTSQWWDATATASDNSKGAWVDSDPFDKMFYGTAEEKTLIEDNNRINFALTDAEIQAGLARLNGDIKKIEKIQADIVRIRSDLKKTSEALKVNKAAINASINTLESEYSRIQSESKEAEEQRNKEKYMYPLLPWWLQPDGWSGSTNPTNEARVGGGPDAAGVSGSVDCSMVGGGTVSYLESETGTNCYKTARTVAGGYNGLVNFGPSLDAYWKTSAAQGKSTESLIKGQSHYITIGIGISFTYSWTEDKNGATQLRGFSVGGGVGAAAGVQQTW